MYFYDNNPEEQCFIANVMMENLKKKKRRRDNHVKLHNHVHLLTVCRTKMGVKLIEKVKETYCKSICTERIKLTSLYLQRSKIPTKR